jgi:hypothetical protein
MIYSFLFRIRISATVGMKRGGKKSFEEGSGLFTGDWNWKEYSNNF